MNSSISQIFTLDLIPAIVRTSTPLVYAAMAAVISRHANVFNIGIEGTMLFSCFFSVLASYYTGSWVLGVLAAIVVGVLLAGLLAVGNMRFKANFIVMGLMINMLASSLTRFLLFEVTGGYGLFQGGKLQLIPRLRIAALEAVPVLNTLFNNFSLFELLSPLAVIVVWFLLYRTVWGLRLRSVGLNEVAATTAGISDTKNRYQALLISGILAGIAGAHLALGYANMFAENMTRGRGFIANAAMNFGAVLPLRTTVACLIFGFCDAFGSRLQTLGMPSQFVLMMPYLITLISLMLSVIRYKQDDVNRMRSISKHELRARRVAARKEVV